MTDFRFLVRRFTVACLLSAGALVALAQTPPRPDAHLS